MAKILIADDDRNVPLLVKHILREQGFETAEASNGLAALELFERQFFDLVITDLRMPAMDGMSFLSEVKKLDPALPVIVLTAYASADTAIESMRNGAFHFLAKPFKVDELLSTVKYALQARAGA